MATRPHIQLPPVVKKNKGAYIDANLHSTFGGKF
jgi:hypothetical protein